MKIRLATLIFLLVASQVMICANSTQADQITTKIGETELHLKLPEGICALDRAQDADRRLLDSLNKPPPPAGANAADSEANVSSAKRVVRAFSKCADLAEFRARNTESPRSLGQVTTTTSKEKYDPSGGAAAIYMAALICGAMGKDVEKNEGIPPRQRDRRIAAAMEKVKSGKGASLPLISLDLPACYNVHLVSKMTGFAEDIGRVAPGIVVQSFLFFGDWSIYMTSFSELDSQDAVERELQAAKLTIKSIIDSNMK